MTDAEPATDLERETMRRVARRLIPLLMLGYFCAYLDRVNVGFAGLTMNQALGLSPAAFGFGAGFFFVGYFLFELPSNLILARVGARRWMARILLTWGIISAFDAFVWNGTSFYAVRFVLGLAEAGFYPGVVLYLTWWFPSAYRSRMMAFFQSASTISLIIGPPISGQLLRFDGLWGFAGWQWLFLLEATPPIVMAVVFYFVLTDRPEQAKWLRPEQRAWLNARIASEMAQRERIRRFELSEALRSSRMWWLTLVYFGQNVANYGLIVFLPRIIKGFGVGYGMTGLLAAVPYLFAVLAMIVGGWHSDRTGERCWHVAASCLICAVGLGACSLLAGSPLLMMAALIIALMGQANIVPIFWSLPTAMLTGTAAAGGIALINSVGNLGGFAGPYAYGLVTQASGSDTLGLVVIAAPLLVSAAVVLALGHDRRLERIPPATARARPGKAPEVAD
jgi:MFS transporter, ACS family, tartrate transporter